MLYFGDITVGDLTIFLIILVVAITVLVLTRYLLKVSTPYLFMGILGLIIGLLVGILVSQTLKNLPGVYGKWIPLIVNIFITAGIFDLFLAQAKNVDAYINRIFKKQERGTFSSLVIDTSVLIDGRIDGIAKAGFILAKMIVPDFILLELQRVADSEEPLKRARGRQGLEVLEHLRQYSSVSVDIVKTKFSPKEQVDSRLILFAQENHSKILTVDYNLNRIAQIQGVTVLNINELAEALKPAVIPGEDLQVKVIQKGKERNQGVGYLPDGTMVVVESGDKFVGQEIGCEVVRIFQTVAGRMIFVQPKNIPPVDLARRKSDYIRGDSHGRSS